MGRVLNWRFEVRGAKRFRTRRTAKGAKKREEKNLSFYGVLLIYSFTQILINATIKEKGVIP